MSSFLSKLSHLLNQPFPERESFKETVRDMFIAAVIVFIVLFGFQPFGLREAGSWHLYGCIIFGLITFIVGVTYEFLFLQFLPYDRRGVNWTFRHWLVNVLGLIFFIAVANFAFVVFGLNGMNWTGRDFLWMLGNTYFVAILPIIIGGLTNQNRLLKKYSIAASEIDISKDKKSDAERVLQFPGQNGTKPFTLRSHQLLYIQAMQNYVRVIYENEKGISSEILRTSIKSTLTKNQSSTITQCHRSYIVNLDKVLKVSGNAQGLQLELHPDHLVPVSRKYISVIRQALV